MNIRIIFIMSTLLISSCTANPIDENKGFLTGITMNIDSQARLIPLIAKTSDDELKMMFAQNISFNILAIKKINPSFENISFLEVESLCTMATTGTPFLSDFAPRDTLIKASVDYLNLIKDDVTIAFNKDPAAKYSPSACGRALRSSSKGSL